MRLVLLFVLLILIVGAHAGTNQYCSSIPTPLAIPESPAAPLINTINVSSPPEIVSKVSVIVTVSHPAIGDLTMSLQSPAATTVSMLASSSCQTGLGDVAFDDAAGQPSTYCSSQTPWPTLIPASALTAFNGQVVTGNWNLIIGDKGSPKTGTLVSWCVTITTGEVCPDGLVTGSEGCDDNNVISDDGCSNCQVDFGYDCANQPSVCVSICGDGERASGTQAEACDDGNVLDGDGCAANCSLIESGYSCTTAVPNVCTFAGTVTTTSSFTTTTTTSSTTTGMLPSLTSTRTLTATATPTRSPTRSPSNSPSRSIGASLSSTPTPSISASASVGATVSPTASAVPLVPSTVLIFLKITQGQTLTQADILQALQQITTGLGITIVSDSVTVTNVPGEFLVSVRLEDDRNEPAFLQAVNASLADLQATCQPPCAEAQIGESTNGLIVVPAGETFTPQSGVTIGPGQLIIGDVSFGGGGNVSFSYDPSIGPIQVIGSVELGGDLIVLSDQQVGIGDELLLLNATDGITGEFSNVQISNVQQSDDECEVTVADPQNSGNSYSVVIITQNSGTDECTPGGGSSSSSFPPGAIAGVTVGAVCIACCIVMLIIAIIAVMGWQAKRRRRTLLGETFQASKVEQEVVSPRGSPGSPRTNAARRLLRPQRTVGLGSTPDLESAIPMTAVASSTPLVAPTAPGVGASSSDDESSSSSSSSASSSSSSSMSSSASASSSSRSSFSSSASSAP